MTSEIPVPFPFDLQQMPLRTPLGLLRSDFREKFGGTPPTPPAHGLRPRYPCSLSHGLGRHHDQVGANFLPWHSRCHDGVANLVSVLSYGIHPVVEVL